MDFEKLSKDYMVKYNELSDKRDSSGIKNSIEDMNAAIKSSDIERVNSEYCKILDWNHDVANIEGIRESLQGQFPYIRLPSPVIFSIAFDGSDKRWKFQGEIY